MFTRLLRDRRRPPSLNIDAFIDYNNLPGSSAGQATQLCGACRISERWPCAPPPPPHSPTPSRKLPVTELYGCRGSARVERVLMLDGAVLGDDVWDCSPADYVCTCVCARAVSSSGDATAMINRSAGAPPRLYDADRAAAEADARACPHRTGRRPLDRVDDANVSVPYVYVRHLSYAHAYCSGG